MSIGNWRIGTRLAAGMGLALAFMVGIAAIGIANLARLNGDTDDLAADKIPKLVLAYEITGGVNDVARAMRNAMLSTDPDTVAKELRRIGERKTDNDRLLRQLQALIADDRDAGARERYAAVAAARERYLTVQQAFLQRSADAGRRAENVAFLLSDVRREQTAYLNALADMVKYQRAAVERAREAAHQAYVTSRNLMVGLTALAALLASLVLWRVTRSITGPLLQAVGVAEAVAGGDLTAVVPAAGQDETGQLLRALRGMTDRLAHAVARVRSGSDTISTASGQIASGNLDLSSRTEQQASSLEETASSMEQLTSAVTQNAEHARQAARLAQTASEHAAQGGAVVAQVVGTMNAIKDSSRRITDIIGVIDGIAFQTNILALNAAVEAARAGEQGRGFAVVAGEVRNLAQRAGGAAREIKELIEESVRTVDSGATLVARTGDAMDTIVQAVQQVAGIVDEISAASQEQSAGIAQVNQAIVQMDDVTQRNAALVEQAAAAAQSMREQAALLADAVSVFRLAAAPRHALVPA